MNNGVSQALENEEFWETPTQNTKSLRGSYKKTSQIIWWKHVQIKVIFFELSILLTIKIESHI